MKLLAKFINCSQNSTYDNGVNKPVNIYNVAYYDVSRSKHKGMYSSIRFYFTGGENYSWFYSFENNDLFDADLDTIGCFH